MQLIELGQPYRPIKTLAYQIALNRDIIRKYFEKK